MRLSDKFFPDAEHVACDCGKVFRHRPTRWKVTCTKCGAFASLHALRCEWRSQQPNAKEDEAKRDAIMAQTAWAKEVT